MNMRYYDKVPYKYFDLLAKLWPVIISIIVVTVAYGVTRNTVNEDHETIKEMIPKLVLADKELEHRVTVYETKMDSILEMVNKIDRKMDRR